MQASPLRSHAERQLQRHLSPLRQAWEPSAAAYVAGYNAALSALGDRIRWDSNQGSGTDVLAKVQLCALQWLFQLLKTRILTCNAWSRTFTTCR